MQPNTRIGQPGHGEATPAKAISGDNFGIKSGEIIARTDHDGCGLNEPTRSAQPWR
jgi:hypothetical protein